MHAYMLSSVVRQQPQQTHTVTKYAAGSAAYLCKHAPVRWTFEQLYA